MKRSYRYELSVGIFVLGAAVILGYVSLKISRMRVRDGIDVAFLFPHACGLAADAPVAVAGVEVGYVKGLRLDSNRALVTARIKSSAGLRRDVRAAIRSKSLLGEPYLELIPGGGAAPLLRGGETITAAASPPQVDQVISWLGLLAQDIDPAAAARLVNAVAEDPSAARRIMKNTDELLSKLAPLDATQLRDFLKQVKVRLF